MPVKIYVAYLLEGDRWIPFQTNEVKEWLIDVVIEDLIKSKGWEYITRSNGEGYTLTDKVLIKEYTNKSNYK